MADPHAATDAAPPLGFRTQPEENAATLPVEGDLPGWLRGTFLLNGPGRFEVGGRPYGHWFDPPALVRRFRIDGGGDGSDGSGTSTDAHAADAAGPDAVAYRCRFLRSRDYEWASRRGRVRTPQPGTGADRPLPVRLWQALSGEFTDNASIGFARVAGDVLAVTESPHGLRIDPGSLATTGRVDLAAGLDADTTLGHVHYDPERRTFVGLGVSYGRDRGYVLFRRPAGTAVPTQVARLPFDDLPYVHAFGLTERYAVVPEFPFGVSTRGLVRALVTGGTFLDAFEARAGPTRFHVLDRATGEVVARPTADRTFAFHVANAYEVEGEGKRGVGSGSGSGSEDTVPVTATENPPDWIVLDLVAYPDGRAMTGLTLANVRAGAPGVPDGRLVRYRLPLSGGRASREVLHDGPVEFPTIHYRRYGGRPYRYVYLAEAAGEGTLPTRLVKVDVGDAGGGSVGDGPGPTRDAPVGDEVASWTPTPGWTVDGDGGDGVADGSGGDGGDGRRDDPRRVDADDPPHPSEATFVPAPDPTAEDDGVLLTLVLDPPAGRSRLVVLDAADLTPLARAPLPGWTPYPFHGQFYADDDPVRTMQ